jgi:hypothetical protein
VAVDAVAAPSETATAPIAADPRHGDAAMISRDQLPRNRRLKIGILLGLAAVAMGIIEIVDNGPTLLRGTLDWWRRM